MKKKNMSVWAGLLLILTSINSAAVANEPQHSKNPCTVTCETPESWACPECSICPPCLTGFFQTGPYVGALLGYNHMWAKSKSTITFPNRSTLPRNVASSKKESDSVIGEFVMGWRYVFPLGVTSGIEVAGDLSNDHIEPTLQTALFNFKHKFKRDFSLTPSLTIGHIFCEHWHAFVKLGLGVSWIKTHLTNLRTGAGFKKSKVKAGFVPAVGLEYSYNCNLSVVGTMGYEVYERVNSSYPLSVPGVDAQGNVTVKPRFFNAKIGVLYKF